MPASVKNIRSTLRERFNKKGGNKTDADSPNKKPPKDYSHTDSGDSSDEKTIIDTIGDAHSIRSVTISESDDVMFTFKKLNNKGSLKQIKGEKGDGDNKSTKSRTSLRSKLSFRKKGKKDAKVNKDLEMPETKNDEVVKPSSIKSASISNAKIGDEKEDTKSLSKSIKARISKSSKEPKEKTDDDKDSDTIKGSILSKSRKLAGKEPKEKTDDDEKSSVISSANSRAKSETKKSDDRKSVSSVRESLNGKDDNKSVASSKKSKSLKGIQGEADEMTKSNDLKDTYSFQKIKLNDNMSVNVFISSLDSKTVAEEPEPISSQANIDIADNASANMEPRVIEVVKEETQENFPYSVKLNLNHADGQESQEALTEPKPILIEKSEPVRAFDVSTNPSLTFDSLGVPNNLGHIYMPTNSCLSRCQYPLVFGGLPLVNFSDNEITFY